MQIRFVRGPTSGATKLFDSAKYADKCPFHQEQDIAVEAARFLDEKQGVGTMVVMAAKADGGTLNDNVVCK